MATIRKTGSKRRKMYFRGTSKRDIWISNEEETQKYHDALFEYCEECLNKHNLEDRRIPRRMGVCRICGNDGFITGCLHGGDKSIEQLNNFYSKETIKCKVCDSEYDDTGILFDPSNESGICGQCLSEE